MYRQTDLPRERVRKLDEWKLEVGEKRGGEGNGLKGQEQLKEEVCIVVTET